MAAGITKARLIDEIASSTRLDKNAVAMVLDQLAEISYREARNGFVIPGICKLKVNTRKASRQRNPATGKMMLIGERDVLKIMPLKKAKDTITPNTNVKIEILPDEPAPKASEPADRPDTRSVTEHAKPHAADPAAPEPRKQDEPAAGEGGQIVFECKECSSLIGAPVKDAGTMGQCPFCGTENIIPARNDNELDSLAAGKQQVDAGSTGLVDFVTFICQTCGQEIEAPVDMMGLTAHCPTCGSELDVPSELSPVDHQPVELGEEAPPVSSSAKSNMTIRIDLLDLA